MYRFACVFLFCVATLNVAVGFKDCGSVVGKFTEVTVSNCKEATHPCILKRETNATIDITFTVDKKVTSITSIVHGVLAGVPVPFPISHPDACTDSGLSCPLEAGGPYNFRATLYVEKAYPKLGVTVKWELKDQDNKDIVCVEIPAKIQ